MGIFQEKYVIYVEYSRLFDNEPFQTFYRMHKSIFFSSEQEAKEAAKYLRENTGYNTVKVLQILTYKELK